MVKEKLDRWQLSEEGEKTAQRTREMRLKDREEFEKKTFPCPVDGKPGAYSRRVGNLQFATSVFQCPDGHEFAVRLDLEGATKLLTPSQGATSE